MSQKPSPNNNAADNNRSIQLNPNNPEFQRSRGQPQPQPQNPPRK
jgi:hypothetical protein